MFKGLEHTALASPNPRALAQWYVDHLEFVINFEYDGNYFVRARNGSMLEIIPSLGDRGPQTLKDPGIRHLAAIMKGPHASPLQMPLLEATALTAIQWQESLSLFLPRIE